MSETENPSNGEHQQSAEDRRPEVIGTDDITALESKVRDLMGHPKDDSDVGLPKDPPLPAGSSPEGFEDEPEDLVHTPYWTTHYRKGGVIVGLTMVEPGSELQDFDEPVSLNIMTPLHVTNEGHRFVRDEDYSVLADGDTFYRQKTLEFDAEGKKCVHLKMRQKLLGCMYWTQVR